MTAAERTRVIRSPVTVLTALRSPRQLSREVLAGMVTTLALIPEVISFSIVAGVDPMVRLVASVVLATTMSILGGRSGVITAAAGSVALVIAPLVHQHGVQYVLPTVILAGMVQIVFGFAGLARLMRFIPRSVMTGFAPLPANNGRRSDPTIRSVVSVTIDVIKGLHRHGWAACTHQGTHMVHLNPGS